MLGSLLISLVMGGLIVWIPQLLARPFLEDLSLLPLAVTVLRISCVSYLFKWLSQSIQSLFMALERPLPSMIISVCNVSAFPLLLIPVLLPWELTGLWWNFPITSLLTTLLALCLIYIYRKKLFQPAKILQGGK